MREIAGHTAGRIFLAVLFLSIIVMLYIPKFFFQERIYFGFMTLPFLSGILFLLLWLVAYLIYFFFFWPYRN
jgi:hypothetical protein